MKFLSFKHINSRVVSATILCAFVFISCEKDEQLTIPSERNSYQSESINDNPYTIPVEDALDNLSEFMEAFYDNNESRSINSYDIKHICTINYKDFTDTYARSDNEVDCDNLLYIASLPNNNGYAVLAADRRIPTKVIGISDQLGDTSRVPDIKPATPGILDAILNNNKRPIFKGYPTEGPGFVTKTFNEIEELLSIQILLICIMILKMIHL